MILKLAIKIRVGLKQKLKNKMNYYQITNQISVALLLYLVVKSIRKIEEHSIIEIKATQ